MAKQVTDLMKLGIDAYKNPNTKFNDVELDDAIRKALDDTIGEWNYYNFMNGRYKFYAILSELLKLPAGETLEGIFDGIVKVDHIELDAVKVIDVENQELFKVAVIGAGNNDIRRQRVYRNQVTIDTQARGIKIYEDFVRFRTGKINWAELVGRLRKSLSANTAELVYDALLSGYDSSVSDSKYQKTGTFSEAKMDELIQRIEGRTGKKCAIYGTKTALGKVSTGVTSIINTIGVSDKMKDDYANLGYFRNYKGTTPMIEIKNPVDANGNFKFTEDYLFILPQGEDIINVVYAGDPIVVDSQDVANRNDQQIEFMIQENVGVGVLVASYYGIYKVQ